MMKMQLIRIYQEEGIEEMVVAAKAPEKSIWTWLKEKLTSSVPIEREADVMLDHNYDGIRELDNSLPPWWVAMFYITIIIGVAYVGYYHVLDKGPLQAEEYAMEMEIAEKAKAAFVAKQSNLVNENNVVALTDAADLEIGKSVYTSLCVACHGQLGEGGVGPNFADEYWIHGGSIKDIFKTIKYGVPEKGMIPWADQMSPADMHRVASFILTFKGTNPPNGKAPQGEIYKGESETATDSTATTPIGMK
jgi:cytochrome c oxidase cbb3-type subunit 3